MEKSRNLELVGASPTEWQLITPRGGLARPPLPSPSSNRVKESLSIGLGYAQDQLKTKPHFIPLDPSLHFVVHGTVAIKLELKVTFSYSIILYS